MINEAQNKNLQKVFFSIVIILTCFLLAQFIVTILISIAPDSISQNIHTAEPDDLSSIQIVFLKMLQFIAAVVTFFVPSILIAILLFKNIGDTLLLKNKSSFRVYLLSSLVLFAAIPWMNYVIMWNAEISLPASYEIAFQALEESAQRSIDIMLRGDKTYSLLINLFLLALVPAFTEEIFFRGLLQGMIQKFSRNRHVAVIAAAFIFSAIHMQVYGLIPRFLLGIFFGYIVVYSRSIWPAVWIHFLNNAMAVVSYFALDNQNIGKSIDEIGTGSREIVLVISSLIISGVLMYLLFRKSERKL